VTELMEGDAKNQNEVIDEAVEELGGHGEVEI
jgi:hypothetical protein